MGTEVALKRSLIDDFGLNEAKVKQMNDADTKKLGETLCQQTERVYKQTKEVRTFMLNAWNNPLRPACTLVSLGTGLARLWQGDVFSGSLVTAMSLKELYNQCTEGDSSSLQRMLNDINADVDMVRSLEEGQQQSVNIVQENILLITGEVNTLYDQLDEIERLNTAGLEFLESGKLQAKAKVVQANLAFRKVYELFSKAEKLLGASKNIYENCKENFSQIKKIATEEDQEVSLMDRLNRLVEVAELANSQCSVGKEQLEEADLAFSEGMKALAHAQTLKNEATKMVSRTVQHTEDTLKAGIEKATYTKACTKIIEATKRELGDITERSNDVMRLLDEMTEDIRKAKMEAAKKLDPSDLVVCAATTFLAASSFGALSAVALGVTSAYAWHNGSTIADTAKKAYNYAFGTPTRANPMGEDQLVRTRFKEVSSGYWGWSQGRGSHTYGFEDVNLGGGEVISLPFDLNNKSYPVSKEDLYTLYQRMFSKLKDNTLEPQRCKDILKKLQHVMISRGVHGPNVIGLIRETQAASGIVKALVKYCNKLEQS